MPSLAEGQSRFIACLQQGPAHFPDDLFAEDRARALLGLKAHANTISHARLVALEDCYPRLHEHIGHEDFHRLSRAYVEQRAVMASDLNHIGAGFPAFLQERGYGGADIDLARIEWAWLESYRSAEALPLALTDIATLGEADLLAFPVAPHPAMRLIGLTAPLSPALAELAGMESDALMIARPEAQILLHPLSATERAIAEKIPGCTNMGNLLAHALELEEEATAMQPIIKLIQAGALTPVEGN
ncbi:DNA-binding domain-containing protein [uncultured Parasphingorhabdus sp.]|uniref:DNA-binding domain-containing protein n=1 Tax=uncultured Parasphingorhabdus sp. TaxID=2709694 RepID=UPI002AA67FB5|nr:DNA-binding domain-containing protein [uncultured Parasphingorhabdus sp.]